MNVSQVIEIVGRMRRGAFSRNRNFDAFESADADGIRARRVWRYLKSLEQDLVSLGPRYGVGVTIRVEPRAEGRRLITIEVPEVRLRRVGVVSAEEYQLLREHPAARAVLDLAEGSSRELVDG